MSFKKEITHMESPRKRLHKEIVEYSYKRIIATNYKEWAIDTLNNTDNFKIMFEQK